MIDLDDHVVLLTGAGGAIGSATARTMVQAGGRLLLHDRDEALLTTLAGELGDRATPVIADLADSAAAAALWDRSAAIHGRIDVLVNNAGIYPPAPLVDPLEAWLGV